MLGLVYTDDAQTTAATIAQAITGDIKVKVDGRVQRTMSGVDLQAIYSRYGAGHGAVLVGTKKALIPIHFNEPWRKDERDQDALAWSSARWQTFQVEVPLPATHAGFEVIAVTDNFVPEKPGMICKWIKQQYAAAGLRVDVSTLERRDWLQQISLFDPTTGDIDRVELKIENTLLHDLDFDQNEGLLTGVGMSPASSAQYDLVLDHDDLVGSAVPLDGTKSALLSIIAAGATEFVGSITAIIQRLGPPE
jgi:hypothetical protein